MMTPKTRLKAPLCALALSALMLSGCGDSPLNPFNWFGRGQREEATATATEQAIPRDGRGLVEQVIALEIDRTPGGAIVHATGLPPTQGYWDAELEAENGGRPVDGVLTLRFLVEEPLGFQRIVNQQSREVIVARFVSNVALQDIRAIRVVGATNSMISRR